MSQTPHSVAGHHGHLTPATLGHGQIPFSAPGTPSGHPQTIGFIGVGNIGGAIAKNLVTYSAAHKAAAHNFVIYNRTKQKAEKLVVDVEESLAANGGLVLIRAVDGIDEIVEASDIIIVSSSTDAASLSISQQISAAIKAAKPRLRIIVDTSTLYPTTAGEIDALLTADSNTRFVAAPVFGATPAAREGKLILCVAGDYASKKKIAYLLVPAAARKCIDLGGNVEKVAAFKLLGNSFIVGLLELLSETHTLAEKVGVGSQAFHELLNDIAPAGPIIGYSSRIMKDDFEASNGFNIDGGLKDVHHMQRLATEHTVPMPVIDVAQQHLLTAKALNAAQPSYKKIENLDWTAMVAASRVASGLDPFDSTAHQTGPVPEDE